MQKTGNATWRRIIMVDYLQLMTANSGGKGGGNREQEIATILVH